MLWCEEDDAAVTFWRRADDDDDVVLLLALVFFLGALSRVLLVARDATVATADEAVVAVVGWWHVAAGAHPKRIIGSSFRI